jgi:hypothetical protein
MDVRERPNAGSLGVGAQGRADVCLIAIENWSEVKTRQVTRQGTATRCDVINSDRFAEWDEHMKTAAAAANDIFEASRVELVQQAVSVAASSLDPSEPPA